MGTANRHARQQKILVSAIVTILPCMSECRVIDVCSAAIMAGSQQQLWIGTHVPRDQWQLSEQKGGYLEICGHRSVTF